MVGKGCYAKLNEEKSVTALFMRRNGLKFCKKQNNKIEERVAMNIHD